MFCAPLILILIQAISCVEHTDRDELLQDLQTLSNYRIPDNSAFIQRSRSLVEHAIKNITSADNCTEVRESFDEIETYLEKSEEASMVRTYISICRNLCLFLKYIDPPKKCENFDDYKDLHFSGEDGVQLDIESDSNCNPGEDKAEAILNLKAAERTYVARMTENESLMEAAAVDICNGLAVFKNIRVPLKRGQMWPETDSEAMLIVDKAWELNDMFRCFADD